MTNLLYNTRAPLRARVAQPASTKEKKYYDSWPRPITDRVGHVSWQLEDGTRHREDGPASLAANGEKTWYKDGKVHRKDGPAVECPDGQKEWYLNGYCHREDGPAIEWHDGEKEWYLYGIKLTEEKWRKKVEVLNKIRSI